MLLSVVIPIYNVHAYLPECLQSIRDQSIFDDLEVILVDDGSTDNSLTIATEFAVDKSNVQVHSKPNGGLGSARNFGMDRATGPLITFVDSDDRVPEYALAKMIQPFSNPLVHVSVGKLASFPVPRPFVWDAAFTPGTRSVFGLHSVPALIHSASACNKVFRLEAARASGLRFREGVHFEDAYFVLPFLASSPVIHLVDEVVYEYRKREDSASIMDSLFDRVGNYWDYLCLIEYLGEFSRSLELTERLLLQEFMARGFQGFLLRAPERLDHDTLGEFTRRAFEVFRRLDPTAIRRGTVDARHRLPFARLLSGANLSGTAPVTLVGETAYEGYEENDRLNILRAADGVSVFIESVQFVKRRKALRFEGRVNLRGLNLEVTPAIDLRLYVGRRSFPAKWTVRPDRHKAGGLLSGFSANVPLAKWPTGEYLPRLGMKSSQGEVRMRGKKTPAFFRNSRNGAYMERDFEFASNHKSQVVVTCRPKTDRSRWQRLQRAVGDIRALLRGDSFGAMRAARLITRPFFRKPIWLIGERWDTAQDNGAALFKYIGQTKGLPRTYYAVDRKSTAFAEMRKYGNVVPHGSLRHKLILSHAAVLANAYDVDTYSLPRDWNKVEFLEHYLPRLGVKRAFLQHGVVYRDVSRGLHRLVQGYDLVVTSAPRERDYFAKELGYGHRAVLTGLPRFDRLKKIGSSRRILFAPTWRSYLVNPSYRSKGKAERLSNFEESDFYRYIKELLESSKLHDLLRDADLHLDFLPHYEVMDFFECISDAGKRIHLLDQRKINFQDHLMSADVFITDYSSTMFDIAYLSTPSIIFAFDEEEFISHHSPKGYFDLGREAFGYVASTVDRVIEVLRKYVEDGATLEPDFESRIDTFFERRDRSNSERVVAALKELTPR